MEEADAMAIHRHLHELEEPYKEVFMLRVFGELSFRKIGEIFGKTESWARTTYPQENGNEEDWTGEWTISTTGLTDSGERVTVREIYCGTQDSNFLIWKAE